jgi:hypothetical protein
MIIVESQYTIRASTPASRIQAEGCAVSSGRYTGVQFDTRDVDRWSTRSGREALKKLLASC